jgi:hypothetical protein
MPTVEAIHDAPAVIMMKRLVTRDGPGTARHERISKEGPLVETEAGRAEKAKEQWAKHRADFEAYIPNADTLTT